MTVPESDSTTNELAQPSTADRPSFADDENGSATAREGLPPGYRMRADRHYIDHLESTVPAGLEWLDPAVIEAVSPDDDAHLGQLVESIRQYGILQPLLVQHHDGRYRLIAGRKRRRAAVLAGLRRVPCMLRDVDDDSARALGEAANLRPVVSGAAPTAAPVDTSADVARSLETLLFCANLLSGTPSDLSRGVSTDLIAAEAWRTLCVVEATRIVEHGPSSIRKLVSPRSVINEIDRGFQAEFRLRNVVWEIEDLIPEATLLRAHEEQLVIALSAAINATLALVDRGRATLRLSASTGVPGSAVFAVVQSAVIAHDNWASRAFDPEWTSRPGGQSAVASMLALESIADAAGGTAAVVCTRRGTSVTLTIPVA